MATHTRTTKSSGGTGWEDGNTITAAEHNAEWDALVNDYNGNVNNDNIAKTAGKLIDADKIDDHASSDAEFVQSTADPGNRFSPNRPTDLEGEIEALRYRIRHNQGGENFQIRDSTGTMVDASWLEPGVSGENLLYNSGFELQTGGAGTAPDGWTLNGAATTVAIEAPSELDMGKEKRSLNIVATGAGGCTIDRVVRGLKADTLYVVGAAYVRTLGSFRLSTTGGLTSANYQDILFFDASGVGLQVQNFVIRTDSSGSDITFRVGPIAVAGADMNIYGVWFKELNERTTFDRQPHVPRQSVKDTTAANYTGTIASNWEDFTHTPLSLSVYVPTEGYSVQYEADLETGFTNPTPKTNGPVARWVLEMDIDGGGWNSVDGRSAEAGNTTAGLLSESRIAFPRLKHVVDDPVPGSTYNFRVRIGAYDQETVALNLLQGGNSRAELELRRL